jgi:hemoglobin/transferrin/lactoferrin receptor protein
VGRDPQNGDLLFQSRNIERARIRGADLRFAQDLAAWSVALQGWTLDLAAYWAEGDNRQTGAPLNSIAPTQAVAGLSWTSVDAVWDAGATLTLTADKSADDIDSAEEARSPRPAGPHWTWRPDGGRRTAWSSAPVFNLTDEAYWRWLDVANLAAGDR